MPAYNQVVPGQESMAPRALLGIHVEETMFMNFKTQVVDTEDRMHRETMYKDHLDISSLCQMMFCPCCCAYVPYAGVHNKMEFYRESNCCKCFPYAVRYNGAKAGEVKKVGCMENGCMFCMCPCFACSGYVKLAAMEDSEGKERFTFLKELFACWPCVQGMALGCAPMGALCLSCNGCYHYCQGDEFLTISQPVYEGPWKRGDDKDPDKIGDLQMAYRMNPVCCCLAIPTPMKFFYKPTNYHGASLSNSDLTILSLVLGIYRGLPVPCRPCATKGFQTPTGIWCLDCGMNVRYEWNTVQEVMAESD